MTSGSSKGGYSSPKQGGRQFVSYQLKKGYHLFKKKNCWNIWYFFCERRDNCPHCPPCKDHLLKYLSIYTITNYYVYLLEFNTIHITHIDVKRVFKIMGF
jgi:hypothetical protein